MSITYGITLRHNDMHEEYVTLTAKTDTGADRQVRNYLRDHTLPTGTLLFVTFYRDDDGQQGYLNAGSGAAITGTSWV